MPTAIDLEFADVNVESTLAIQLSGHSGVDPREIGHAIRAAFESLMSFMGRRNLAAAGAPRVIYTGHGADGIWFTLAMPIHAQAALAVEAPFRVETLPARRAYRFTHHGPYENLRHTYHLIEEFLKGKGWMKSQADWAKYMPMWEEYLNDPQTTRPENLLTHIYLPVT